MYFFRDLMLLVAQQGHQPEKPAGAIPKASIETKLNLT